MRTECYVADMWLLLAAHAQECAIRNAVAGFPLGFVPPGAVSTVVFEADCALGAEVAVYDGEEPIHVETLLPEREGAFQLFQFQVEDAPLAVDLFFEVGVTVEGETVRYVAGWYQVDGSLSQPLTGTPELGDVQVERRGEELVITAAVLPASAAPEALFLWRVDGELVEATVSTQGRVPLVVPASHEQVCIEVEEIGVDGSRAVSQPRCIEPVTEGCGCRSAPGPLVGWGLRR